MQLFSGVAAVCCPVPALQFITEHQQESQRMLIYVQWLFVISHSDVELKQAVVQHDGRQRIYMHFIDLFRAE